MAQQAPKTVEVPELQVFDHVVASPFLENGQAPVPHHVPMIAAVPAIHMAGKAVDGPVNKGRQASMNQNVPKTDEVPFDVPRWARGGDTPGLTS